jgi:hypothetical protein
MAYDAIMRWENEGGAPQRPASSEPTRRRPAARMKQDAAKSTGSGFRGAVDPKRHVRKPPDGHATA